MVRIVSTVSLFFTFTFSRGPKIEACNFYVDAFVPIDSESGYLFVENTGLHASL